MSIPVKLAIATTNPTQPKIIVKINDKEVTADISPEKNEFDNITVDFVVDLLPSKNTLTLDVTGLDKSSIFKLEEIIADQVRFGLVTFLCTTVNGQQSTQLDKDGCIEIELQLPIWQFWCERINDFNYEKYPLGTVN
jgi:hypothetical protein